MANTVYQGVKGGMGSIKVDPRDRKSSSRSNDRDETIVKLEMPPSAYIAKKSIIVGKVLNASAPFDEFLSVDRWFAKPGIKSNYPSCHDYKIVNGLIHVTAPIWQFTSKGLDAATVAAFNLLVDEPDKPKAVRKPKAKAVDIVEPAASPVTIEDAPSV